VKRTSLFPGGSAKFSCDEDSFGPTQFEHPRRGKPLRPSAQRKRVGSWWDKIEFYYTPKHGSWLNKAEAEINIMGRQCLDRRLDNRSLMTEEVAAWENASNARKARVRWTFTLAVARQKLRKRYPSIED
jgi:hypothetical protein